MPRTFKFVLKHRSFVRLKRTYWTHHIELKRTFCNKSFIKVYFFRIQILRPTQKLIIKQLLSREQNTSSMDVQALSMMLNLSNVHSNSNVLVCESSAGILTGAVMGKLQENSLTYPQFILSTPIECRQRLFSINLQWTAWRYACTSRLYNIWLRWWCLVENVLLSFKMSW